MMQRILAFAAIVLTAVALVPGGAHLAAMAHKLALSGDDYVTVQAIYHGWSLFGIALSGALAADLALAVACRRARLARALALAGCVLMAATLAVFFQWTYPANQATADWTIAPATWQAWRQQWEYAHAAGAALTFLALCAATGAALAIGPDGDGRRAGGSRTARDAIGT